MTEQLRPFISVGVLACLLIWETSRPFFDFFAHARRERSRHLLRNVSVAILNTVVISFGFVAVWAWAAAYSEVHGVGLLYHANLSTFYHACIAILILDGWTYFWHWLNHRVPLFWRFHRMHHSDTQMDVTTAGRFHLGEITLSSLFRVPIILLVGVRLPELVTYEVLMFTVVQFHHANVGLPERLDRLLRLLIVTPSMHKVHHSRLRAETDSNYTSLLSFWDRLFGTFRLRSDVHNIHFGVDELDRLENQTIPGLLRTPFINTAATPERSRARYAVLAACIAAVLTLIGAACVRRSKPPDWAATKRLIADTFPQVQQISTAELSELLAKPEAESPVLLDVRSIDEYEVSHLASATRVDPAAQPADLPARFRKDRPIVVYCSVGYRSAALAERLQNAGFTHVRNLEGSIFQWINEGRPIVRNGARVYEVHPYDANWGRLLDPGVPRRLKR